jgi:hypothetical protein
MSQKFENFFNNLDIFMKWTTQNYFFPHFFFFTFVPPLLKILVLPLHRRFVGFPVQDKVMVRIQPERFSKGVFQKLYSRKAGPYRVLQKAWAKFIFTPATRHLSISPNLNEGKTLSLNLSTMMLWMKTFKFSECQRQ